MCPKMKNVMKKLRSVVKNEKGATMVEYALMVALIAVVALAAVTAVGTGTKNEFTTIAQKLGVTPQ
ncbi:Flp family type IVb pilin [Geomonas sp. RF6]|uniref:Flp family type IVb pilin n=1 Tax=Geomonas sp. RF6 TaxID=2897342 RepID=UPI001E64C52A|nr:Flp family type IVb pilin [Geomonas sp. RF6]UFS70015.1 Flp family type IVb pilin [Geomonas sp. RF6]